MTSQPMKTHDWIALFLLAMLVLFGVLSYFMSPKDAENAKTIVQAVITSLGMIFSFKFGVHVATPPPGTSSTSTTSSNEPAAPDPNFKGQTTP